MGKKKTLEQFIEDCNKKFNNKFDYSKVINYETQQSIIIVVCPIHGDISVKAVVHYQSEYGCKYCFQESQIKQKKYIPCEICGRDIDITLSRDSKKRYCSYECMGKAKDNKKQKICTVCHKPYKVKV